MESSIDSNFTPAKKGEKPLGKTKKCKGTKWMIVIDGKGTPLGVHLDSAFPHEMRLVDKTLGTIAVPRGGPGRTRTRPERLIGDKAYESDPPRTRLKERGIEIIAPHKNNRKKPPTQDGRKLRRYRCRWEVY